MEIHSKKHITDLNIWHHGKHKGYAIDGSGWVYGLLYKDNPRFEAMIYDGNEYVAVKPETVEKYE
jgi:hypothetical protein